MPNNGRRNASEPGTHMMTPAADWSSRAESPAEPRHLRVVGIEQAVGERQQGRQERVLTGRPGSGTGTAARATSAAGWDKAGPRDTRTRAPCRGSRRAAGNANRSTAGPARRRAGRARTRWRRRRAASAVQRVRQASRKIRRSRRERTAGATQ